MTSRPVMVILAVMLATAVPATSLASAQRTSVRKCFKRVHGKRVRVRCAKQHPAPVPAPGPTPTAPQQPAANAGLQQQLGTLLGGQLLHHFSTNGPGGFSADEQLNLCGNGTYFYVAQYGTIVPGLTGLGKTQETGSWRMTIAALASDGHSITAGLDLTPSDGDAAHLKAINYATAADGTAVVTIGTDRWYAGPSSVCAGP